MLILWEILLIHFSLDNLRHGVQRVINLAGITDTGHCEIGLAAAVAACNRGNLLDEGTGLQATGQRILETPTAIIVLAPSLPIRTVTALGALSRILSTISRRVSAPVPVR